jgi:hypothetical protein
MGERNIFKFCDRGKSRELFREDATNMAGGAVSKHPAQMILVRRAVEWVLAVMISRVAEGSWRKRRFLFYKCKNFKWFSLLVDTGRFSRCWDEDLRFASRKLVAENEWAEEGRGLVSWAGAGDARMSSCSPQV